MPDYILQVFSVMDSNKIFIRLLIMFSYICDAVREVVFLSTHSSTGLAYSLDYVGPAIDIALAEVNQKYSPDYHFSLVTFNRTNSKTCEDVESDLPEFSMEHLWRSKRDGAVWAILAAGCSGAVVLLADLGREFNLPIITSAGTDTLLDSRVRFPGLLRLLPYQQMPETIFIAQVCDHFRWTDTAIICDEGATESNFYALICKTLTNNLNRVAAGSRNIYPFNYSFVKNPQYRRILLEASRVSRVLMMITHASRLKAILAVAEELGMTDGEYAFIAFEPFPSPNFGTLDWRPDQRVRRAFEFLLVISTALPDSGNSVNLDLKITSNSATKYGKYYAEDEEVSPFVHAYHDGVHILSEMITENWDRGAYFNDSLWIQHSAWGRTFNTQRTNLTLNNNGDMANDYVVRAFDSRTNKFLPMMMWNQSGNNFRILKEYPGVWPRNGTPPQNRPECGFSGLEFKCSPAPRFEITCGNLQRTRAP